MHYRYLILLPLAVIEGPILAVIAGFLCTKGLLNPFIVLPVIIIGDIIGDSITYTVGRWGLPDFIKKIVRFLDLRPANMARAKTLFESNPARSVSLSKITLGIGIVGIYLAGNARIPYTKFIKICFFTSLFQYIFYISMGLLFGQAYIQISHYLDAIAAIFIVTALAMLLLLFIRSILNKI